METSESLKMLNEIFRRILKKEEIILTEGTTAHDVDGWDSLTNMTLLSEVEKVFKIRFTFREMVKLKNVGDLCRAIADKTK